ncbi:MAG: hypothetical protein WB779_05405 [Ignavibacteriaceae bacterium]
MLAAVNVALVVGLAIVSAFLFRSKKRPEEHLYTQVAKITAGKLDYKGDELF